MPTRLVNVTVENDTRVHDPYPRAVMAKIVVVHCLLLTRPVDTGSRYTLYPCLRFVNTGIVRTDPQVYVLCVGNDKRRSTTRMM